MWEHTITPLLSLLPALTRAVTPPHDEQSLRASAQAVADALAAHLPDVDGVAVALLSEDEGPALLAATGAVPQASYDAQAALGDGPCLEAFRSGGGVHVDAEETVARWPGLREVVTATGVRAQYAAPLLRRGRASGVVTVFATRAVALGPESRAAAEHAAALVSTLVEQVRLERSTAAALETRSLIGQAIGVVTERYGLDPDRAFDYLKRLASDGEVKLRVLAQDIVDGVAARGDAGGEQAG